MDDQNQEIVQQAPVQTETPTQNSNSNWLKTLSIGLGVIGIGILIGITGYFLAAKKSQLVQINPKPISVSPTAVSPNDTSNPTASWKTYIPPINCFSD